MKSYFYGEKGAVLNFFLIKLNNIYLNYFFYRAQLQIYGECFVDVLLVINMSSISVTPRILSNVRENRRLINKSLRNLNIRFWTFSEKTTTIFFVSLASFSLPRYFSAEQIFRHNSLIMHNKKMVQVNGIQFDKSNPSSRTLIPLAIF